MKMKNNIKYKKPKKYIPRKTYSLNTNGYIYSNNESGNEG